MTYDELLKKILEIGEYDIGIYVPEWGNCPLLLKHTNEFDELVKLIKGELK